MFDRMRSIYPALSSAFVHAWVPLVVGLGVVAVIFGGEPRG